MHARFRRHRARAEYAMDILNFERRQQTTSPLVIGGFTLTGPITVTVVQTATSTSSRSTTTSSSQTTTRRATPSTPTPTPSPTSSISSISPSITNLNPSGTAVPGISKFLGTSPPLSTGDIVAIVLGILLLILIPILVFACRRRLRRGREKLRASWTQSRAVNAPLSNGAAVGTGAPAGDNTYQPKPIYTFTQTPAGTSNPNNLTVQIPPRAPISVAPSTTYSTSYAESRSVTSSRQAPPYSAGPNGANVYSPGAGLRSPFTANVTFTFIVNLPDELPVNVGENLRVLAEYDDGWALCANVIGEQGMVPLECLSLGGGSATTGTGSSLAPPTTTEGGDRSRRGSKRASSLDPKAQALKDYRI